MTTTLPNTLFERMVARTLDPRPGIEAPREPLFDRFEEEVVTSVTSRPPAEERRFNRTAGPESEPAEPLVGMPWEPGEPEIRTAPRFETPSIEPAAERSPDRAEPVPVQREPAPQGPSETRIRTIRESYGIDRVRIEQHQAPGPLRVEPRVEKVEAPMTVLLPPSAAPRVEPDLPPAIPPPPPRAHANPAAAPPEPVIHVTIGRLEIRMAEKEKPATRRARTPQGPSLEQYLAQRRGGAS